MRNIILFFIRYYFFFLFIFLEIISFYVIINNNFYQRTVLFTSSNRFTGSVYSAVSNFSSFFYLRNQNRQLAEENARLLSASEDSYVKTDQKVFEVNDTLYMQKYQYLHAEVISNSINKRNDYLIINKGKISGVKPEMGVISPLGVVGIVREVSDHYASCFSLLHKDTRISAKLKRINYVGNVSWNGDNYHFGQLSDIPAHVDLSKGDTVLTSGYSFIFPEGLMIGTIEDFSIKPGRNFYDITIRFSVDLNKVRNIYIVRNLLKEELIELNQTGQDE